MKKHTVLIIEDESKLPEEMAEAFWEMDSEQQARFFNRLATAIGDGAPMQWADMGPYLTEGAHNLLADMQDISC